MQLRAAGSVLVTRFETQLLGAVAPQVAAGEVPVSQAADPRAAADSCALLLLLPALGATTRSTELACTLGLHCARAGN